MPKLPAAGKKPIRGNFYHWRMGNDRTTVWAVCEDEWESNGPIVAFTSEGLANEHCAALNADCRGRYAVVVISLLDAAPQRVTWHHRQASINADGTVRKYEQKPCDGWDYEYEEPTLLICENRFGPVVNAYATSAEAALTTCEAATEAELAKRGL